MSDADKNRSRWTMLARIGAAFFWALLTEAAFFGVGEAVGYFSYSGPPDGWHVFSTFLFAYIAALIGLPFSLAVLGWRLWKAISIQ